MRATSTRPDESQQLLPDLPAIERAVSAEWARSGQRARRTAGPAWTCYSQPSPVSGVPGLSYARALAAGDVYPRFKMMQGFDVSCGHGWDCHGPGIERAVAAELGLTDSDDVESFGVASFVTRCRESAVRHASAFAAVAARMGCLSDPRQDFATMDGSYIESVWSSLKRLFEAGLLTRDYRVGRYCPRCQNQLAEHELHRPRVYRPIPSTAVTCRLRLDWLAGKASRDVVGADLLVWTAEPWMIPASTGVAVHPGQLYAVARRAGHGERVIVAERSFGRALGEGWHIAATVMGSDLAGASFRPAFERPDDRKPHRVHAEATVAATSVTGAAPLAPAYGAGRLRADRTDASPAADAAPGGSGGSSLRANTDLIGPDGRFDRRIRCLAGMFFADVGPVVAADLADRGLLFAADSFSGRYPHCWWCGSPLLARAASSWYVDGDWAVSRSGYWGIPLPLWECERGHIICVGSLTELSELAGLDLLGLDPHRPSVDHVHVRCRECGTPARRVTQTLDACYDAGAMPFARHDAGIPAELAVGGTGHPRSWFYAMTTISALIDGRTPFRAAITQGSTLDGRGHAMSARDGSLIEPLPLVDQHGADALRWYFASMPPGPPAVKVSKDAVALIARRVLRAYLGSALFFARQTGGQRPTAPPGGGRPMLDRWLLSELHTLIEEVTESLETFRADIATSRIGRFVRDLAAWYVPAAKRSGADLSALGECLDVLTRLMAPVAPFLSDYVWSLIRRPDAPDSVHQAPWPLPSQPLIDERLSAAMAKARTIAGIGSAARAAAKVPSWQPLAAAQVAGPGLDTLPAELLSTVAMQLNVKSVTPARGADLLGSERPGWALVSKPAGAVALDLTITPELRREGLARSSIQLIKRALRRNLGDVGARVAVHWYTSDEELAVALSQFGPMIAEATSAAQCNRLPVPVSPNPGAIEVVGVELGATFWLAPDR